MRHSYCVFGEYLVSNKSGFTKFDTWSGGLYFWGYTWEPYQCMFNAVLMVLIIIDSDMIKLTDDTRLSSLSLHRSALQGQKAVTAYFSSKQLLPFGFALSDYRTKCTSWPSIVPWKVSFREWIASSIEWTRLRLTICTWNAQIVNHFDIRTITI